jgi:hypothetical protein
MKQPPKALDRFDIEIKEDSVRKLLANLNEDAPQDIECLIATVKCRLEEAALACRHLTIDKAITINGSAQHIDPMDWLQSFLQRKFIAYGTEQIAAVDPLQTLISLYVQDAAITGDKSQQKRYLAQIGLVQDIEERKFAQIRLIQDIEAVGRLQKKLAAAISILLKMEQSLMLMIGDEMLPIEDAPLPILARYKSSKPWVFIIVGAIYGIWWNVLGLPRDPQPSPNLKVFATEVFRLFGEKGIKAPAVTGRLTRGYQFSQEINKSMSEKLRMKIANHFFVD